MVFCVIVAEVDTVRQFATTKECEKSAPGLFAAQQRGFRPALGAKSALGWHETRNEAYRLVGGYGDRDHAGSRLLEHPAGPGKCAQGNARGDDRT